MPKRLLTGDDWYRSRLDHGLDIRLYKLHRLPEHEPEPCLPLSVLRGVDDRTVDVELEVVKSTEEERIIGLIDALHPREALVLRQRYFEDRTLDQVGYILDVPRERVRQIQVHAERRLRLLAQMDT